MAEQSQSLTYHSLHRHVQSLLPQYENKDYPSIYSSNQQPHLPSILSRSRQKKSHEKSLKKGISRVSKSKQNLKHKQDQGQEREKSLSKGTLLNFNIQEVLENKYHITKPKDEIRQYSPQKQAEMQTRRIEQSPSGSNQKSFISEYRIVTYVPSDYNEQKKNEMGSKQGNFISSNLDNWNKENSLKQSNLQKGIHKKNDSEEIHVINSNEEHVLQLNTWRTSEYYDPYYSSNFGNQLNQSDQNLRKEKGYTSFQQKYSIPLTLQIHERQESNTQHQELKNKIRHLEHEIVQIERQKTNLAKENQTLKSNNFKIIEQSQTKSSIIAQLQSNTNHLLEQISEQDFEIKEYQEKLNTIKTRVQSFPQPHFYEQNHGQRDINSQFEELQLLNAKISKQISEKNLIITQLNKKNRQLFERVSDLEKQIKNQLQEIQNQQEKLSIKDQKIVLLSQEINRMGLSINQQQKSLSLNSQPKQQNSKYHSLPIDRVKEQANRNFDREELESMTQKYDKLLRDFNHLQKKHLFMKDQLDHLRYLQNNTSSSALTHRSVTKNQLPPSSNQLLNQYQQTIEELQVRLEISQRSLNQVSEEYSNLKQNFRALEELYIKQQNDSDQIEQQLSKITQENNKLKIELINMEEISKAKSLAWKSEDDSMKLMEKEEIIINLKRQLNSLERTSLEFSDQIKILQKELQQINRKYIEQVQKNAQLSRRHNDDLTLYMQEVQKQQKEKTSLIILNYESLISKLNEEISLKKQQLRNINESKAESISKLQERHKRQIERIRNQKRQCQACLSNERKQRQNSTLQSKYNENHRSPSFSKSNYESINRKDSALIASLQQDYKVLQKQYKVSTMERQRVEKDLRETERILAHLQEQIYLQKTQKNNSIKQKLEACQQLERVNSLVLELKKLNFSSEDQKFILNSQLQQLNKKYIICMKQNQSLIDEIKNLKKSLSEKNILLESYQHDIRSLRITILEEQQLNQKKTSEIDMVKELKQNHKSKEEYYKMLYEKTLRQLQLQLQQKSLHLLSKEQAVSYSSPVKNLSPLRNHILIQETSNNLNSMQQQKDRQTQLYRIQIYKDLNKLFNLTSQTFTLEQILQKNQQQYLRKLFNAIKEDHDQGIELKQLIVSMEESFKKEKIHIKQDYDLVYQKYLKYKSMCQAMERDIERFKIIKKNDLNFAAINI